MTIFHVLKYQFSSPPELNELKRLPPEIYALIINDMLEVDKFGDYVLKDKDIHNRLMEYLLTYKEENIE